MNFATSKLKYQTSYLPWEYGIILGVKFFYVLTDRLAKVEEN